MFNLITKYRITCYTNRKWVVFTTKRMCCHKSIYIKLLLLWGNN